MKIGVKHDVKDPAAFAERGKEMIKSENLPSGIEPKQFCPASDGSAATCVWEADAVDQVSEHIDPALGDASNQEYFAIDEDTAFGLPE